MGQRTREKAPARGKFSPGLSAWEWLETRVSDDARTGVGCGGPAHDFLVYEEFDEGRNGGEVLPRGEGTFSCAVARCTGAVVDGHVMPGRIGADGWPSSREWGSCSRP